MSVWLLDVNVLVARFWDRHVFHHAVRAWMNNHARDGWATCPITQAGLVRTLSNPAFAEDAPNPAECVHWVNEALHNDPHHQFWSDDVSVSDACATTISMISGFRQLTDAYLLGLAMHRKARFITLDQRILHLAPQGSAQRRALTVLKP